MDHPCYRCQSDIPEGTAFCPHCGAPQIRVLPPEGEAQPTADSDLSSANTAPMQSPPSSTPTWSQGGTYPSVPSNLVRWDLAWRGALLCGVGAAILSAVPFVSIGCCLWMLGAGAFAVSLYRKQLGGAVITPGMGMRVGALAGVFGFIVNAIVTAVSFVALRTSGNFRQAMEEQMKKQMASAPDPKVQETMQHMLDWMNTPQGAASMMVMVLIFMGIVFILFSAAGGALGASMSGRRREFH